MKLSIKLPGADQNKQSETAKEESLGVQPLMCFVCGVRAGKDEIKR